ncbi:hypothetical protein [Giesbergeria anulus]|nr:hypothetical protein [Giesbergeria anulus]
MAWISGQSDESSVAASKADSLWWAAVAGWLVLLTARPLGQLWTALHA